MHRQGLRILIISIDKSLTETGPSAGNAKMRHLEYAKRLDALHIVAKGNCSATERKIRIADNLFVYPVTSRNRFLFLCQACKKGAEILKKERIDLVCCQDPFSTALAGYLLKLRFHIPLNIHIPGDTIDNPYFLAERKINYLLNIWAKWVIPRAQAIRVSTSKQKKQLAGLGIEDKKIWHIPFFINFDLFLKNDGESTRKQYLNDKFDRLVLYAGRLVKQKNLETLIQAVPFIIGEYPKVLFLIIGTGPEERRIKNFVLNLGAKDNVCLLGNIPYDKIPDFFSACDLFVTTSLYEGTNMTLLEAGASGKPVVSSSHAGAYDAILDGRTGYLVDFGNSAKVAEKILYLIAKPQLAEDMGSRGREFVLERFNKDKILKDSVKMWEEAINYRNKTSGTIQMAVSILTAMLSLAL